MIKKTKIVATISDQNCDVELLKKLYEAGMNVVRLNTAHQTFEDSLKVINNVRAVSSHIALLLDTKGPEIRTTEALEEIPVSFGDEVIIKADPSGITSKACIYVNYPGFVYDVPVGSRIMIDDGEIELTVIDKNDDALTCRVNNQGFISGKKSVNIPSIHVKLPSLSKKDIAYIHFAIDHKLDFIAHSFVRNKEDVKAVQDIIDERGSDIKIIAKIENQEGVDKIDEILDHVYGVMVARGDLAVEIPQERIPVVQKMIVHKCIACRKPVIIATQMMQSMICQPRPTRAEISDVANAVYDCADAVMLSGETAYGKYPVEVVETMTKIALEVESAMPAIKDNVPYHILNNEVSAFLALAAVRGAAELNLKAIIADTKTGKTVRAISAYRGNRPTYALCYNERVMRELALSFGVIADYSEMKSSTDEFLCLAMNTLQVKYKLKPDDKVIIVAGNFGPTVGPSYIEIGSIQNLNRKCSSIVGRLGDP